MNQYLGKIVGMVLGFALAGPLGAIVGFALGHLNDSSKRPPQRRVSEDHFFPDFLMSPSQRSVFAVGVIALGAKLAKVDGKVTREEVLAFRRAFRTHESQLGQVGRIFDKARETSDGYEAYAVQLAQTFAGTRPILEEILTGLFFIAIADNKRLARSEIVFLRRVSVIFGFSEIDFQRIASRVGIRISKTKRQETTSSPIAPPAYGVLGLPETATDKEIKKTYRALIRKHHPDMLVAKGVSAQEVAAGTERMKKINAAYSELCKLRSIK